MIESGWIAALSPGRGPHSLAPRSLPPQMARGSLMLEFSLMRDERGPLTLIEASRRAGVLQLFSLSFGADGHLSLLQRRGEAVHALSLDMTAECAAGGRMRLVWSWDVARGLSLLSLEAVDHGSLRQRVGAGPLALERAEAEALVSGSGAATIGPRVEWLALGDHIQSVGPGACFAPSTPIETPTGPRPAGNLRAGDLVETVDAGPLPVLWSGRVALPALGALRPVRLCAPSFGASTDLWLAPQHRVALGGPTIDYLFGEDEVLVAARHLVDGSSAQQPDRPCVLSWQGLLLAGHHLLVADGCRIESLSIGRLARQTALARTTVLAPLAAAGTLPLHSAPVRRTLLPYEAQALGAARAQGLGPLAA